MEADRMWDRFDLELFCQHCAQYLMTLVGVERKGLDAARRRCRAEAQAHANEVGHEVEVTYHVSLKRRACIRPQDR